jgi:hypothetical protein
MEERFTASDFNWTQLDPFGDNHQLIPAQYPLRFSRYRAVYRSRTATFIYHRANQISKGGVVHKVDIRVFSWIVDLFVSCSCSCWCGESITAFSVSGEVGVFVDREEDEARRPVRAPELARRFAAQMPVCDQRSPLLGFSTRRWLARIVRHLHVRKLLWN